MPLTRGDKMIIAGAAGLAVTVVLGLAVLKKPYLFTGRSKAPTSEIPPAPSAGPAAAPAAAPVAALPLNAPPNVVATPPATTTPAPVAAPTPHPSPALAPPAAPAAATPGKTPLPKVAGDESLEKMFEELANDAPSGGKSPTGKSGPAKAEAKAPAAAATPAPTAAPTPVAVAGAEPQAAPAPGDAAEPGPVAGEPAPPAKPEAKPDAKPEAKAGSKAAAKAAKAAKAEPPKSPAAAKAEAKPAAATAASGNVIRVIAEERPGEYVLVIQTNKPPTSFERKFYTDPPRLILDIAGSWNYNGPLQSATGDPFIRQIRVGKHPDLFRVVLDMAPDATTKLRGAPVAERVPEGVALKIPK